MTHRSKAVFNWSGGKDSALALLKAVRSDEYDIVSLLTTVNGSSGRSSMHAIPQHLLEAQAASTGLPLMTVPLPANGGMDEYANAMRHAVEHFKAQGVSCFIFGDIFLHDVRLYREQQLAPYGIEVAEPLWGLSSQEVMEEFIASGLRSIIVTTMADLLGREYVGRTLDRTLIESFPAGIDPCGENGEYHTFCFDGPLFSRPISYTLGEPLHISHDIGLDDGTTRTFHYWHARLE